MLYLILEMQRKEMTIFMQQGIKILFIHIPKTGGTTFTDTMIELGWEPSFCIRGKTPDELIHLRTTPQHYHAKILNRVLKLSEFDLQLSIMRNPFERLKSEFYWQRIKAYRKAKADEKPFSYPDPIQWFHSVKKAYKSDKFIHDNHIRPQIDFFTTSTEVFKLESNGIISAIERCQDLLYSKTKTQSIVNQKRSTNLPLAGQTRKCESTNQQFDSIKDEINDFYKLDFEKWNQLNRQAAK